MAKWEMVQYISSQPKCYLVNLKQFTHSARLNKEGKQSCKKDVWVGKVGAIIHLKYSDTNNFYKSIFLGIKVIYLKLKIL